MTIEERNLFNQCYERELSKYKREKETFNRLLTYSPNGPFEESFVDFENISYDQNTNILTFKLIKITAKSKIVRYVTKDYVRIPIYGDVSQRTKSLINFSSKINPYRFAEEIINKYPDLSSFHKRVICSYINVYPRWMQVIDKTEIINLNIQELNSKKRNFLSEKKNYSFKREDYPENYCNFKLRLGLAFITFGLSFIGYRTKAKTEQNRITNIENKKWNLNHKENVDLYNDNLKNEIIYFNISIDNKIFNLKEQLDNLLIDDSLNFDNEDDFLLITECFKKNLDFLKARYGVYIIWNKTKNKYYVGQSKDLYKRIFTQHFSYKDCDVKNPKFIRDYDAGDEFYLRWEFCNTKDELNNLERDYINLYDSFENGYNDTGGNK